MISKLCFIQFFVVIATCYWRVLCAQQVNRKCFRKYTYLNQRRRNLNKYETKNVNLVLGIKQIVVFSCLFLFYLISHQFKDSDHVFCLNDPLTACFLIKLIEGCSNSDSTCFSYPNNCHDTECRLVYKWTSSQDGVSNRFSITARVTPDLQLNSAWIAIGFSDDQAMVFRQISQYFKLF